MLKNKFMIAKIIKSGSLDEKVALMESTDIGMVGEHILFKALIHSVEDKFIVVHDELFSKFYKNIRHKTQEGKYQMLENMNPHVFSALILNDAYSSEEELNKLADMMVERDKYGAITTLAANILDERKDTQKRDLLHEKYLKSLRTCPIDEYNSLGHYVIGSARGIDVDDVQCDMNMKVREKMRVADRMLSMGEIDAERYQVILHDCMFNIIRFSMIPTVNKEMARAVITEFGTIKHMDHFSRKTRNKKDTLFFLQTIESRVKAGLYTREQAYDIISIARQFADHDLRTYAFEIIMKLNSVTAILAFAREVIYEKNKYMIDNELKEMAYNEILKTEDVNAKYVFEAIFEGKQIDDMLLM